MKLKTARKNYKCTNCKGPITKGQKYARKSFVVGLSTIWAHSDPIPDWAWEKVRQTAPVCRECSTPKATA